MRFLVTGANGFVGQHLVSTLKLRGYTVNQAVRRSSSAAKSDDSVFVIGDIGPDTDWEASLRKVDVIVHLAARVHNINDTSNASENYHKVNVLGTERLATQATASNVKRFVYISSIGVNGKKNTYKPFTEIDKPSPHNAYTVSKWNAEQTLKNIISEAGLELVILRPPLVYGPGNPGNFRRLLELISKGIPLPFRSIDNRRSLLYIGNLVDAIILCSIHPLARGKTYFLKDFGDISTPDLVRQLAILMKLPPRIFSFPPVLLRWAGKAIGKSNQIDPLLDSLTIDDSMIRSTLDWQPPFSMADGLKETVRWFIR